MSDMILELIPIISSIVVSVVTIGISIYKVIKKGKLSDNTNKLLGLLSTIPDLVVKAEEIYGVGKGPAKLDYVLTKLKLQAVTMSIDVTDEVLTKEIESVVYATNQVNTNTGVNTQKITNLIKGV